MQLWIRLCKQLCRQLWVQPSSIGAAGRLAQTSRTARAIELAQEVGPLAALALLFAKLPGELGAVYVGFHRFKDQALELGGSRASTSHWTGWSTSKPYRCAKAGHRGSHRLPSAAGSP
ncbi:hypothetical protein ACF1G0_34380 [Streptomyces sp. NPDC013953]|uniref:hypothetical protein n=1 Tax=Streptomyces sp. NPDC013953 TaxID=3364868 RepID=UPI0036FB0C7A